MPDDTNRSSVAHTRGTIALPDIVRSPWWKLGRRLLLAVAILVGTVLLVYIGGRLVISGEITAGEWFLFFQSVALFWMPMTSIASFWSQFQQGLGEM